MNTFYRPGLVEMFLHGTFNRHSWFANQYVDKQNLEVLDVMCRICLEYKNDAAENARVHQTR